jgi:ribosomal protein L11 methyltransferase
LGNRFWPALEVAASSDADTALAIVDDFSPTAVEEREATVRIFFDLAPHRDAAVAALTAAHFKTSAIDVDDEDWARRSQANLQPITIGRITITPAPGAAHPAPGTPHGTQHPAPSTAPGTHHQAPGTLVILPSTGFGTGHHATTRLCLHAMQTLDLSGLSMLDVGTGSGVLAIAAVMLGAARALGVDYDADAIRAANENLELNPGITDVEFRVADLSADRFPAADIVTANLTGALLVRSARLLWDLVRPGGTLVVSGLLEPERDDVFRALFSANPGSTLVWEQREDGWAALGMCCN